MKFIIPKNYKFSTKLLGLIDYQTAILDGIFAIILYLIIHTIFSSITIQIYCFIGLFFPFFLFSIIGSNQESILSLSLYIIKFYKKPKIYLYKKFD